MASSIMTRIKQGNPQPSTCYCNTCTEAQLELNLIHHNGAIGAHAVNSFSKAVGIEVSRVYRAAVYPYPVNTTRWGVHLRHYLMIDRRRPYRFNVIIFKLILFHVSQKVELLESCKELRRLYLYGNRIHCIENLQHLTHLQVLWLNTNFITNIEVSLTLNVSLLLMMCVAGDHVCLEICLKWTCQTLENKYAGHFILLCRLSSPANCGELINQSNN